MVLSLGGFKFDWIMTDGVNIETEFGISNNDRIKNHPSYFRTSLGKQSISIDCKTIPASGHGNNHLNNLYALANLGGSYILTSGNGKYLGRFAILKISEFRSAFTNDGYFFMQSFSLELERDYDEI